MSLDLDVTLRIRGKGDGQRVFEVAQFTGREAINSLFDFSLDVVGAPGEPLPDDIKAGVLATLELKREGELVREIHGMLDRVSVELEGSNARTRHYHAHLVPRASRTMLVSTQQVFMDMSVPDVIRHKLERVALTGDDVLMRLHDDYQEREFVVQYRETDSDFIGRLVEHLGISFYFDHSEGTDRIVFSDQNAGFQRNEAIGSIWLSEHLEEPDRVYRLRRDSEIVPKLYVVYDYNYRKPALSLISKKSIDEGYGGGVVEYGCHIKSVEDGDKLAAIRADELRCRQLRYSGDSSIPLLSAGLLTELEGCEELDGSLLITAVEHRTEATADGGFVYHNRFEAIDAKQTFRPLRTTPKPRISGFVTGVVMGADGTGDGKASLIDDEGRYTVQFHFDSVLGKLNAKASRPVRKAQPYAGANEGMHFPLRPGVEVALGFADGDPDRPVIIGALPNHTKRSVVTARNSTLNRIETSNGVVIQFGSKGKKR